MAIRSNDTEILYAKMRVAECFAEGERFFSRMYNRFWRLWRLFLTVKQVFIHFNAMLKRKRRGSANTKATIANKTISLGSVSELRYPTSRLLVQLHGDTSQWTLVEANEIDKVILELSHSDLSKEIACELPVVPENVCRG